MTLHIDLPPDMEMFIKSKVAEGCYRDATEVIHEALRRMQTEEARLVAWKTAVKQGDDELEVGQSVPYTAAELHDINQSAKKALRT